MRHATTCVVMLLCVACGKGSAPSATGPTSASVVLTGTLTDTVTGQTLRSFDVSGPFPVRMELSHPGYVTRTTWILGPDPRIDLFPEAGFDLGFYRELARGARTGTGGGLRILEEAPKFYLQTLHLGPLAADLERVTRQVVPMWTGGRMGVTVWETGVERREPRSGWIMIQALQTSWDHLCGRSRLGEGDGLIELALDHPRCPPAYILVTMAHELGHAFGFSHVTDLGAVMYGEPSVGRPGVPTARERHHAGLAYARRRGNADVDVDPVTPPSRETAYVVID